MLKFVSKAESLINPKLQTRPMQMTSGP